jgi:hypothetical protein
VGEACERRRVVSEVLHVGGRSVAVTRHAVDRYRMRVDRRASVEDVLAVVASCSLEYREPGWVLRHAEHRADAWLVVPGRRAVFPLRFPQERTRVGPEPEFVAATCLTRPRLSKPDRRWLREQAEEDAWAAR